jgi:hypothetical protein
MTRITLGEVRIVLDSVEDKDAARDILNRIGGVSALSKLPESKFAAVIKAANAHVARGDARPVMEASRERSDTAREWWDHKKAADAAGEPVPDLPADPWNQEQLEKLQSREGSEFREFVNGTGNDA